MTLTRCQAAVGSSLAAASGAGSGALAGGAFVSSRHSERQRRRAIDGDAPPCRPCRAPADTPRAGIPRQLLADGLLDHARAGKADQRARLRDMHVAEHGVGGGHAAGGRIGQHDDVGLAGFAQHLHRDRGARQLHQREDAFLHARAAGGREHDEGRAALDRGLEPVDDGLAGRHAERAAHEIEILHRGHHRQAVELAVSRASPRR